MTITLAKPFIIVLNAKRAREQFSQERSSLHRIEESQMSELEVLDENIPRSYGTRLTEGMSKNFHRRFDSVASYVAELGGDKSVVIEKVLIANNGVAAVKAIRSIRRWAYEVFGNERTISFVVMATPEDLRANAEYIRMGDVIVDVPGGSNNHNYANVTLIVELARLHGVHAVWAGWGHASENPVLPDTLAQSNPPIKFIGPAGPPMRALGDKIGSTIIAQSAGVPCIAWNGQDIEATYDHTTGSIPEQAFEDACIESATEAKEAAARIGFPIMIKASEGGGGKGIRRVDQLEDVANAYRQVCGEVPGSPIFIMKLSSNSRHLEVQVLADEYGDAVALNGRDCSVQRRHQKIIEEGPPVAASPVVWKEMEKAAVALAKAVRYSNAGTVEYLYSESESKFYFLELNPRLQVEHPVTEMITKVNLPAAQLQVAMGIPLDNIPEIRELYGRNRFEDNAKAQSSRIDFANESSPQPNGHCIAVRITAENAEAGFKPTSGGLQEINFRSTPNVWGYFSMDSSGSIHEFADSQFGHLFANGPDREQARRNMALALKELSIRGDISTTVDYVSKLIELDDFVSNNIDTGWLDCIIKENVDGMGAAAFQRRATVAISDLADQIYVVLGATIAVHDKCVDGEKKFIELLEKGQLPPKSLLKMNHTIELILKGTKYCLACTRNGPNSYSISIDVNFASEVCSNVRVLSDGGYLIDIAGNSHVAYVTSKPDAATGMRINVGGKTIAFSPDYDPTVLRTEVAGKLVKKLKPTGSRVKKGEPYCEIEVMKMFMPLKVEESGIITWCMNEGGAISAGDRLATLELENPENVSSVSVFSGELQAPSVQNRPQVESRPHLMLRNSMETLQKAMSGYVLSADAIETALANLALAVTRPSLPVFEIREQLSVLAGRIPGSLFQQIDSLLTNYTLTSEIRAGTGVELRFPAEEILSILRGGVENIADKSERSNLDALLDPLKQSVEPYARSNFAGVPGAERALTHFLGYLRQWISVERWFYDIPSMADAIDNLRRAHKDNLDSILPICKAHGQLGATTELVIRIISIIGDGTRVDFKSSSTSAIGKRVSIVAGAEGLPLAMPLVSEIGAMGVSDDYAEVALRARKLLMQESMPSLEQRRQKLLEAARTLANAPAFQLPLEAEALIADHIPMADVFLPLLQTVNERKEEVGLLELYLRNLYSTYTLTEFKRDATKRMVTFSFFNKPSEGAVHAGMSVSSMTELSRMVSSGSLNRLADSSERSVSEGSFPGSSPQISQSTLRTGVCSIIEKFDSLRDTDFVSELVSVFPQSPKRMEGGPVNVLYLIVTDITVNADEKSSDSFAKECSEVLATHEQCFLKADIRRVSLILQQQREDEFSDVVPALFTFRSPTYTEDSLYRQIDPSLSMHLQLHRVATNFHIKALGSRHTSTCHVHLYAGTPRIAALAKDRTANKLPRMFARVLSSMLEFSSSGFERIMVDALNAMDLCPLKSKSDNHLFINLLGDFEGTVIDPVVVEQVVVEILKRHGDRVSGLGIVEVETRIVCSFSSDSPPIAIRLFASNPTGFVQVMDTYVEAVDEVSTERVFKLISGTKASLASAGDSSWDGLRIDVPYPLTRPFDGQRKAALASSDTVYCYDLPALFEAAVEMQWRESSKKFGMGGPLMVMYTNELVVQLKENSPSSSWSMEDYLSGKLELASVDRRAGLNDVGMVAWLVTLKTVEYPNGRQVVLIANDITHKAGSFGTREDVVFKMASEYARSRRIPRIFIAANSGARIGLADKVKKKFKVAFKDDKKPELGFDFLYLTEEDYSELALDSLQVIAEKMDRDGQTVYKVNDIIGLEPDLGVENLKGSGLIAGETSAAYDDILTMTIVLGRTVGIGAYLVRLGQRTIQKSSASPIILTGYQALNKLMGTDVYSTNDQLGGPGIMYMNGISHIVVPDHLGAIKAAVDWISFVPSIRGGLLPITDIRGVDEVERTIDFTPQKGIPYDPRHLLAGVLDDSGEWLSGFFDKGSFYETLAGWAKTVVVGRARLGGIPMGCVITENRTTEAIKPADPADLKASESVIQEAGCVWFPNSAYKTAQAIKDFRTEDLPLIVFANWRGFSGGQRDMFDEVLKYGSLIVDAFVAYTQPVFVFIPPHAEIRGGAWVVLDASINSAVMEMYAAKDSARGGVLEANGAASVKYRAKDLIVTMHRLDSQIIALDQKLNDPTCDTDSIQAQISAREQMLLPVYSQVAVQFCELHDTPGRMKAVGVIEREVEWKEARSFFYWRLRRKLAEFDLRKQLLEAGNVGRGVKTLTALEASGLVKSWFAESQGMRAEQWSDDKVVLTWMAQNHKALEQKIIDHTRDIVSEEVYRVLTAGGGTARVGLSGIANGISRALENLSTGEKEQTIKMLSEVLATK